MSRIVKEGLTFDDVLLIPQASDVLPNEVDLRTTLTKGIDLTADLDLTQRKPSFSFPIKGKFPKGN